MPMVMIYFTAGSREDVLRIGRAVVEERLAACVNVLGEITSIYRWEGAVHEEPEVAAIVKTTAELAERAIGRIKELHDYDCPAVLSWPIPHGNPDFLKWVVEQTQSSYVGSPRP